MKRPSGNATIRPVHAWTRVMAGALMCGMAAGMISRGATPAEQFEKVIRPILERKCSECHGTDQAKGGFNIELFRDFASVTNDLDRWKVVFERVQAFEMPPKKAGELKFDEQRKLVEFLRGLPKPAALNCDELASDRTANFYRGYVMSRRLNRAEYANTIRDTLGVELDLEELLPADGGGGEGFDTTGSALFLSPIHVEKYMEAAEKVMEKVLPESRGRLSARATAARKRLGANAPWWRNPSRADARRFLDRLAREAWRRPLKEGEVDGLLELYDRGRRRGDSHWSSLRLASRGVLVSPHFLFLAEPEPEEAGVRPLASVPLASKLSYFLWSSKPDERLMRLAESGSLLETNVLQAEVRRMLADPRAEALGERFALQWLDLDRLGTESRPDATRFPEFDRELAASMRGEVVRFFNDLVRGDRSLLELIDSRHTFVDARLAMHYGWSFRSSGDGWERVTLPTRQRGGLVGMAAVHVMNSYPTRTSPVLRGRWVLESLLGEKVPPPPEGTPTLEEKDVETTPLSLRQQLEKHRTKAECAACHDRMDPLGFGLEPFDVLGRWREAERGIKIDAQGILPSGKRFEGPAGLREVLMERKDAVMKHLARKLAGFAFGRELNKYDDCVIDRAMEAMQHHGYKPSVLVETLVTSFPFRHRFYPKQEP